MPQVKRDAVHRHFTYEEFSNSTKCNLCGNKFKGKHTTNLKNHLAVKHAAEYKEVQTLNKEINPKTKESKNDNRIKYVQQICVQLVSVYGRPLSMIDDEPFQKLLNLAAPSNEINKKNIRALIPEVAYDIKLKIAAEIRQKLISLKVDSATCLDRRFLGINVQYIKNEKIIVRNLSVSEIHESQTSEFLKRKLVDVLNEFMITKENIYSLTTDNGANMKKMTKLLGGDYYSENSSSDKNSVLVQESEDEEDCEVTGESEESTNSQLMTITNLLNSSETDFKIRGMLCAAHTIQLAVKDAIDANVAVQILFNLARRVSKILRTPSNRNLLKMAQLKTPVIDCATRWTSKYNMLIRLQELREFCKNVSDVSEVISPTFWHQVDNIVICLEPFNKSTLILQKEQLTIGDFNINWMECKSKVESIRHPFSVSLYQAMESREQSLLETDVVLEGLYLDSRLNIILSEEQCIKAKKLLKTTLGKIAHAGLNCPKNIDQTTASQPQDNIESQELLELPGPGNRQDFFTKSRPITNANARQLPNRLSNDLSVIEQMLVHTEMARNLPTIRISSHDIILQELRNMPRLPLDTNIITHWCNKQNTDITMLAKTVLATPVTQVSVERLFSSLKFLFNPLRANLDTGILKDMLLIKANKDLITKET